MSLAKVDGADVVSRFSHLHLSPHDIPHTAGLSQRLHTSARDRIDRMTTPSQQSMGASGEAAANTSDDHQIMAILAHVSRLVLAGCRAACGSAAPVHTSTGGRRAGQVTNQTDRRRGLASGGAASGWR